MKHFLAISTLVLALLAHSADVKDSEEHHHHHHKHPHHKNGKHHHHAHHGHHRRHTKAAAVVPSSKAVPVVKPAAVAKAAIATNSTVQHKEDVVVQKLKKLEEKLASKRKAMKSAVKGSLLVNGPLPQDFKERFSQGVSVATGIEASKVRVSDATATKEDKDIVKVTFMAPPAVVKKVEDDASDPESKLSSGVLRPFLVARDEAPSPGVSSFVARTRKAEPAAEIEARPAEEATPVEEKGIDIDTAMPYGDLEPFGREDTAQELTESSVKESDEMVDQLERAEVAEEKRAVFRALTRLRGAAITSFDGVARSQTGNIDEYNKIHKWRNTHPLHHLADEESDVAKWAFPDNADF